MIKKAMDYFYDSWIQTTGEGWTRKQVFASYCFSVLFALAIVFYSYVENLGWSWAQILAAALIAWDLGGGVLGYNHKSIKLRRLKEKDNMFYFHHNLQHIHPLILIFFNNKFILLGLTIYWFLTFMFYVEFLEVSVKTGERKLNKKGEAITIIIEITVAIFIICLSFFAGDVDSCIRLFGILLYGCLIVMTLVLIKVPVTFQRTISIMMVVIMVVLGMYIYVPLGFGWLIPVYYLKLLTGFTARE